MRIFIGNIPFSATEADLSELEIPIEIVALEPQPQVSFLLARVDVVCFLCEIITYSDGVRGGRKLAAKHLNGHGSTLFKIRFYPCQAGIGIDSLPDKADIVAGDG